METAKTENGNVCVREHHMSASSKRAHDDDSPPTTFAKRAKPSAVNDLVQLNVGGQRFFTTVSTLTANSAYFSRTLSSRWREEVDTEEIFLDRDPAAFSALLACMRTRVAVLPSSDHDLSTRIILEADYFEVGWFLKAVKAKIYNNTYAA